MKLITAKSERVWDGTRPGARQGFEAFTMIEIALSLAIIAFAVVAIIGILPAGLLVQKENREDTIINQDGPYLLEAIRSGATNLLEISNHVQNVAVVYYDITADEPGEFRTNFISVEGATPEKIIGLLAIPRGSPDPAAPNSNEKVHRIEAEVTAFTGALVEHTHPASDVAFNYLVVSEVVPFQASYESWDTNNLLKVENVHSNLFDLRLMLRWPLIVQTSGGETIFRVPAGGSRRTFRTLLSGAPLATNDLFYFETGRFSQVPEPPQP